MTSKKWVNGYAPMYDSKNVKLTTVPYGAVVESFGWEEMFNGVPRENVAWQSAAKKYDGFIYSGYLEPYVESFPKNCVVIDSQTPDPTDAEQFALLHGMKQVNLCGELCAAFLLGIPLADLLAEWHRQEPRIYESVFRLFSSRLARGTGLADLQSMFAAFNKYAEPLADLLRDPILNRVRYTESGLRRWAGHVICGVRINKHSGRLAPAGILHWVVVVAVAPERTGYGEVYLYNPFPNRIETYSWAEFTAAAGVPYGVVLHG